MRKWLTSRLLQKILVALLGVSLLPLWIVSGFALQSYRGSARDVVQQSKQALDEKALEGLEGRTLALAQTVASFLQEREGDLRLLATLPRTPEVFADFAGARSGRIWTITEDGTELRFEMPLYRQLAFVDSSGQEVFKVTNACQDYPFSCAIVVSDDLVDVSVPENTLFKNERYFSEAMALGRGEIYVGQPVGLYVPYGRAYAGAQNRTGDRYRGVLRFAMPVFEGDRKVGIVVSAMEMLHLIELTAHIAPSDPRPTIEIDPRETDFAYLVAPDGWTISHPRHFNIAGVDAEGRPVPSISEDRPVFAQPGNLTLMGFADPHFPELVARNQRGESGRFLYTWNDRQRALTYATVPYYTGRYDDAAGFGLVIVSTDGARFHLEANLLGTQIENRIAVLSNYMKGLAAITLVVTVVLAVALTYSVVRPVLRLTDATIAVENGQPFEPADIEDVSSGRDEIAHLGRVFGDMVLALRRRMSELHTIYQIGQDITATLEVEETLQAILDRVRDVVAYDAAEITLFDRQENALIVATWSGAEDITDTRGSRYPLGEGFTGFIGQERRSLLVPDILARTDRKAVAEELTDDVPVRSLLGVPLLIHDRLVGTLELVSSRVGAFDENDQRLLETIAPQAAIAIEKAQQVREREQRLRAQIEQLRIEIDQVKRERQVAEITETDYFQRLVEKAREIRG